MVILGGRPLVDYFQELIFADRKRFGSSHDENSTT